MRSKAHGMSNTRPFRIWVNMRNRCRNQNIPDYQRYGARGIKVCDRWQSFEAFWEDMRATYAPDLMIDRIDNDGDYEPGNCRWTDAIVQNSNRRDNHMLWTPRGEMTLTAAARAYGVSRGALRSRVKHGGVMPWGA